MKRLTVEAETPLERKVKAWVNSCTDGGDVKDTLRDLLEHGCQSGMVSDLIYYHDTVKFYKKHQDEIGEMLAETYHSMGCGSVEHIFGDKWNKEDPLASGQLNQNLLAWFGFEETARKLADKAGIEI
jgi:hypothetical protein